MPINNYDISKIVDRIMLVMPSKFDRGTHTNLYAFWSGIAEALHINTKMVDELFRQTNLASASGEYVDVYISDLAGLGRKSGESDEAYKTRYLNNIFVYNCTTKGIRQIVIDYTGESPYLMYNTSKRGAFTDSRYYYNDPTFRATYASDNLNSFKGYIRFLEKPFKNDPEKFDELCKTINAVKASGVKIYIVYPEEA